MNNKVYYGEYTLKYWIDLMLKGKIVLPEYQRTFVWSKEQVVSFSESIIDDVYIPPVTIGHYNHNGVNTEIIIDGQQRLTSLLLIWLNVFPAVGIGHTKRRQSMIDDNDDISEDNESLEWTFKDIVNGLNGKYGKREIRDLLKMPDNKLYNDGLIDSSVINDEFFEKHYIGYAYLVPDGANAQYYYSKTYKIINSKGVRLNAQEARKSLYYMSSGLEKFFNPTIQIRVNKGGKEPVKYNVDFVRYLSFAFQYYKQGAGYIAKKFARRYEDYYQAFILSVIDDKNGNHKDERFEKFNDSFLCRIDKVIDTLKSLNPVIECSIIDQDIYLCGIVYWIVMENSSIDFDKKEELFGRLNKNISDLKKVYLHKKNPAAVKYLNERVSASISIYEEYINGEG